MVSTVDFSVGSDDPILKYFVSVGRTVLCFVGILVVVVFAVIIVINFEVGIGRVDLCVGARRVVE